MPPHQVNPPATRFPPQSLFALGIVYGDVGTSPLDAVRQCFRSGQITADTASIPGILWLIGT